ncbi:hypothetical protein FHS89_000413 [Rubricella aquisinus]|uniref:Sulphur transport domain-containing protein n=1 Tax=Rubricella aquisinus TaxID=2028108 RepID=A0A840WXL7_9RHOB|nr:YeeE/YedE thiosulfate transporter family protein [Rubricella aquisinus]MBB5514415.1 hypothetical protein [Rubricella aquisinus]
MIETAFTPYQSLIGGALIGLSAVFLMSNIGRIMGATGILAGVVWPSNFREWIWRVVVLAGMATAPFVMMLVTCTLPEVQVPVSLPMLIVGGLIVGVGVTLGGGCTSGHGVCGIARLSTRSIIATITFMVTAFATVYVIRHVVGL